MPPRPTLPADDLYARLEIPVDAGPEVIEVAWRSLLRQHHPDVAGDAGLERSKRINVAHDWLSDPGAARPLRPRARAAPVRARHGRSRRPRRGAAVAPAAARPIRHRPPDPAETLARFLDRVAALEPDEIDRLACAEPTPIAFGATIARFLPPDQLAALASMETAVDARLAPAAAAMPGVRDAVEGYATELVLGDFLDELLSEPFRERARERLTRGWEAAVGQPRYGPNGVVGPGSARAPGAARPGRRRGARGVGPEGRPRRPVGGAVAARHLARRRRGAAGLVRARRPRRGRPRSRPRAWMRRRSPRARRAAERLAHLLVLRHAFAPIARSRP